MPGDRVLMLGEGDLELETSLSMGIAGPIDRSAAGLEVAAESYDLVAVSREATLSRRRRPALMAAAARAVSPRGMVIAEFPSLLGHLARPLLAYEGLGALPITTRGGMTYRGSRRLLHQAGLARQSSFVCLPSLADPRVVLPLDSAPALSFHFQRPFFVETFRRRLLRRYLSIIAHTGILRAFCPGYAMFATREANS